MIYFHHIYIGLRFKGACGLLFFEHFLKCFLPFANKYYKSLGHCSTTSHRPPKQGQTGDKTQIGLQSNEWLA